MKFVEMVDAQDDTPTMIEVCEIALISHKERPGELAGVSEKISVICLKSGLQVIIRGHLDPADL